MPLRPPLSRPQVSSIHSLQMLGYGWLVIVIFPIAASSDPIADPNSIVVFRNKRFTILTSSLIRMESSQLGFDDRESAVFINRRMPTPHFSVSYPNASSVMISTEKLTVTYNAAAGASMNTRNCSCNSSECRNVDEEGSLTKYELHNDTDAVGSERTPACPDGLTNQTLTSCFCACMADVDCESFVYAPPGADLERSCWLIQSVKSLAPGRTGRIFGGRSWPPPSFTADNLVIDLGGGRSWSPGQEASANLNGSYPNLDCYAKPADCVEQVTKRIEKGLLSRDGWAVWDDVATVRLSRSNGHSWQRWRNRTRVDEADLYFFGYGRNYTAALGDFLSLSGPPALLNVRDYGLWWSNSLTFSEEDVHQLLLANFSRHNLPFTHLVLDLGWHQWQDGKCWASYTWNRTLFPDVEGFLQSIHSSSNPLRRGISLSLNIHPGGVEPAERHYADFERALGFDPARHETQVCQLESEAYMQALFDTVLDSDPDVGVDSWWTDGTCDGGTYGASFWNQYVFAERVREHRGLRGAVLSRWGGVGSHRYPIGFSGDQTTSWPVLQFQVESTPTAANVMFNSWSHDIGGFDCCGGPGCPFPSWEGCEANSSTRTGSQLLVRWLQHGALSPIMRTHCGGCNRLFWEFPAFDEMRAAMWLRAALLPYIYTANWQTRQTGISLVHPMYYEWPDEENAYRYKGQYMFGDKLLVAPIVKPIPEGTSALEMSVWLPAGTWISWDGKSTFQSETAHVISLEYTLAEIPIFVRGGAVVPMRTASSLSSMVAASDPLKWSVFPGNDRGEAIVYEDDGATLNFEHGSAATTKMSFERTNNFISFVISPTAGNYSIGCSAEVGYELAGATLFNIGVVPSPEACCNACSASSSCAFWTFATESGQCELKASKVGRRTNASAVSGVSPRYMSPIRSHIIEIRVSSGSKAPAPERITLNGMEIPFGDAAPGWHIAGHAAATNLTSAAGAVVIDTGTRSVRERLEIIVAWPQYSSPSYI
eukprot:TRINITY_DN15366_c0_g1_i1.p1 TRINITY_DN15366_c0_g1~~TRINITY_DN15366_c0_g1_i1.p1  ORF type:complete len:993 (+),score=106.84 TRINITY_DN15366_c0_g1_i1:30-3008(+)